VSNLGSISADGRLVAFGSLSTNLHSADGDGLDDVFLKGLTTGAVSLLSVSAVGIKGDGHSGAASSPAEAVTANQLRAAGWTQEQIATGDRWPSTCPGRA
jgi:hypothetical protein